jgi:hypothetical protein
MNRKFLLFGAVAPPSLARLIGKQTIQNLIAVPPVQVLSTVPGKYPFGWLAVMPNLFFHQRYPPKIT